MRYKPGTKLVIHDDDTHVGRATVLSNGRVMVFGGKGLGTVMDIAEWYNLHKATEEPRSPTPPTPEPEPEAPPPSPEPPPPKPTLLETIRHALSCHQVCIDIKSTAEKGTNDAAVRARNYFKSICH